MGKHTHYIQDIYRDSKTRVFYSLARHAMKEGMNAVGVKQGSKVLVPSFICRDVLAPFNESGCEIIFYELNEELNPVVAMDELPKSDAILMVHFFGLEAKIDYFVSYCKKWNAKLIEDNAHGFLSRSTSGQLLGTYGDVGVISIRKTLPVENGALLLANRSLNVPVLPASDHISLRLKIKTLCRPIVKLLGFQVLNSMTNLKRSLRKLLMGEKVPVSTFEDELSIPADKTPYNIEKYFQHMDYQKEMIRRRELYFFVKNLLKQKNIKGVKELGSQEVPYVYPFYCSDKDFPAIAELLVSNGLEAIKWPALPKHTMTNTHPDFYEQLYMVKFVW